MQIVQQMNNSTATFCIISLIILIIESCDGDMSNLVKMCGLMNFTRFSQAICTEAGLMALRERRMKVTNEDFKKSKENVLYKKQEGTPEGLYL